MLSQAGLTGPLFAPLALGPWLLAFGFGTQLRAQPPAHVRAPGLEQLVPSFITFVKSVFTGIPRPTMTWVFGPHPKGIEGSSITVTTSVKPHKVLVWHADTKSTTRRDFRLATLQSPCPTKTVHTPGGTACALTFETGPRPALRLCTTPHCAGCSHCSVLYVSLRTLHLRAPTVQYHSPRGARLCVWSAAGRDRDRARVRACVCVLCVLRVACRFPAHPLVALKRDQALRHELPSRIFAAGRWRVESMFVLSAS